MIPTPFARSAAVVIVLGIVASISGAGPGTKDDESQAPSFPIDAEAKAFVGRFDRTELVKDEVFVKVLKELAGSKLSPEAKADAFALMQERIGWLFVGAARLFPKCGYAQTMAMILSTYFKYQEDLPAGLDVAPLLELSRTARAQHPLRASNALLLATILNHKAVKDAVSKAIDAEAIRKAPVPAIDLHNLCLAAPLVRDPAVLRKLVDLLPGIDSEESREDVIAATSLFKDDALRDKVEQFVRRRFPGRFDNSDQTALIVLAHVSEPEHFRTFYKSLGDLTKDKKDIDRLRKFWDSGFRDRLTSDDPAKPPLKIWDGFTLTLVNEGGGTITYGKSFRYWISFR
jgi:hypothetical protein